ncbi:DUF418 domain-containing protein [Bacillus megaterium]|nr:DUF418 domain-containing protein [Priestia megaterium]
MTLFYIGLAAWLFEKWEHIKIFEYLESIGKMALSNYMLQNVVASIVFYGWGMGIGLQKLHAFAVIGIWFLFLL